MNKRLLQLVVPPAVALVGAVLFTQYRLHRAEADVAEFCATIARGLPARKFIERALEANFEVHDFGAESATLVASTTVFAWRQEIFECRATRDSAGVISSVQTARRAE